MCRNGCCGNGSGDVVEGGGGMIDLATKRTEQRECSILRIMQTCKHFTGIQHRQCKAGVVYYDQFGTGEGCFANIPCVTSFNKEPAKECPKVIYPSREEAEQEQAARDAHSKKSIQAMNDAHADAKAKGYGKGKGGQDSLKCPLCEDGTLRYSVASVNGHMHACCTNGCVSWME